MPHLVKMQEQYEDLVIVGVTTASRADAAEFARKMGVNYSILPDAAAEFDAFGIGLIPASKLVGPDGRVVADGAGASEKVVVQELGG